MKLRYYSLICAILSAILVFMISCDSGKNETAPPRDDVTDTETDKTDGTEDAGVPDTETSDTDDESQVEDETKAVIFVSSGQPSDCYIVYSDMPEYSTAIALRALIKEATGVTLTANVCAIHRESQTPELIIGFTNRAGANEALLSYIAEIGDEQEYFLFIQKEDDLIFYATSHNAYAAGVEAFPDIFLKDGSFSCEAGRKYVKFLEVTD